MIYSLFTCYFVSAAAKENIKMKPLLVLYFLAVASPVLAQRQKRVLPIRSGQPTFLNTSSSSCPSHIILDEEVRNTKEVFQSRTWFRPCECGGPGWERVAYYNFSKQECPPEFKRSKIRGILSCLPTSNNVYDICGDIFYGASLVLPVEGRSYSSVCGQVRGHEYGVAFYPIVNCNVSLENVYVEGVSLTHGLPGNRSHIWTFAAATADNLQYTPYSCPCSNTGQTWPHTIPAYVGHDYFCDSYQEKTEKPGYQRDYNDPLWDGQGCGSASSCCELNHPPYFCKHLNYTTSDDLEIRLFTESYTSLSLIEIYVK